MSDRHRELSEDEDQGLSLDGRWVNSHELRCGDRLIGQDGKLRTVLKIEQEYVQAFLVHNLTIDEQHTFAVGPDAVLVHNTAKCDVHGNSYKSPRPATLYERFDAEGNFLKHGVSQDPATRYSAKELDGGFLVRKLTGPRRDIIAIERDLVERMPGPLNREPWAGIRRGE